MTRPGPSTILVVVVALSASPALAVTFTVDSTVDLPDATVGDGVCAAAGGACTLRAAVQEANARRADLNTLGPDTVALPAGVYDLTIPPNPADEEATGDLDVTDVIEIVGAGPSATIIDGHHIDRIIQGTVFGTNGVTLTVRGVTLRNGGNPTVVGGGVFNTGDLLFEDVVVRDCVADIGGGIYSTGTLIRTVVTGNVADACCAGIRASEDLLIIDSTISDNHTDGRAGGLFGYGHFTMYALRTTFSGNTAGAEGGGLLVAGKGTTLVDSTISGNRAGRDGGGIYRQGVYDAGTGAQQTGRVQLWNSTVAFNVADADGTGSGDGGGVASQDGGGIYLRNTILAGNVDGGGEAPDCAVELWSDTHNLVQSMQGCSFVGSLWGDLLNVDPMLGPLAANGGPTETHALLPGSPAIEAGHPNIPGTGGDSCSPVDQRGVPRPQPSRCDIGAYEAGLAPCTTPRAGCTPAIARGSSLKLRRLPNGVESLAWKWKGAGVAPADLGHPPSATGYSLCVFDSESGSAVSAPDAVVPAGPCEPKQCWKTVTGGFTYRSRLGAPSGVTTFSAKARPTGAATISVKAGRDFLTLPALPLAKDPAVTVQLGRLDGSECWEARFGTAARNDGATFSARSD